VYDPLHVLWLGVARSVWKTLRRVGKISDEDLVQISRRVNSIRPPSDVANFGPKVLRDMSWMKGADWQSWVLVYSMYALHGILSDDLYTTWGFFVRGCSLLCQSKLTIGDVDQARVCLRKFYESYSKLVHWKELKPNFHFMLHLPDCVLKFGSIFNFQCTRFESHNGYLGKTQTNFKSVELQMMKRFWTRGDLSDSFGNHLGRGSNERYLLPCELLKKLSSISVRTRERAASNGMRGFHNFRYSFFGLEHLPSYRKKGSVGEKNCTPTTHSCLPPVGFWLCVGVKLKGCP
jgi:hypothetical protein